jgi:hypothetical protein
MAEVLHKKDMTCVCAKCGCARVIEFRLCSISWTAESARFELSFWADNKRLTPEQLACEICGGAWEQFEIEDLENFFVKRVT